MGGKIIVPMANKPKKKIYVRYGKTSKKVHYLNMLSLIAYMDIAYFGFTMKGYSKL